MTHVKFDHSYISVVDMDRAVKFYEELLGVKVTHREENTWADFDLGSGAYFGLINPKYISNNRIVGNNSIPVFSTNNVDEVYEKIKGLDLRIVSPLETLDYTNYFLSCI